MIDRHFDRSADMRLLDLHRRALGLPPRVMGATSYADTESRFDIVPDDPWVASNGTILIGTLDAQPRAGLIAGALITISMAIVNDGDTRAKGVIAGLALPAHTSYCLGTLAINGEQRDENTAGEYFGNGTLIGAIEPGARSTIVVRILIEAGVGNIVLSPYLSSAGGAVIGPRALRLSRSDSPRAASTPQRPFYEFDETESARELYELDELEPRPTYAVVAPPELPPVLVREADVAAPDPVTRPARWRESAPPPAFVPQAVVAPSWEPLPAPQAVPLPVALPHVVESVDVSFAVSTFTVVETAAAPLAPKPQSHEPLPATEPLSVPGFAAVLAGLGLPVRASAASAVPAAPAAAVVPAAPAAAVVPAPPVASVVPAPPAAFVPAPPAAKVDAGPPPMPIRPPAPWVTQAAVRAQPKVPVLRSTDEPVTILGRGGLMLIVRIDRKRLGELTQLFQGASLGSVAHFLLLNALAVRHPLPGDGVDDELAAFIAEQEQLLSRALTATRLGKDPESDSISATLPPFPPALPAHSRPVTLDATREGTAILVRAFARAEISNLERAITNEKTEPFLRAAQLFVGLYANDVAISNADERRATQDALNAYAALATAEIGRIFLRVKLGRVPAIFAPTDHAFDDAARTVLANLAHLIE